jgi:protein TonB
VEEIFKVVEDMPRFPGCEDLPTKEERKQCADKKMLEFIYKNIKYPAIARENGVEGTAVVQFVVETDGSITDANVVRDPGAQTGAEALRVVNLMKEQGIQWIPGKQRGRAVRVQFNLPVRFRLE